jgi:hypothetical protein
MTILTKPKAVCNQHHSLVIGAVWIIYRGEHDSTIYGRSVTDHSRHISAMQRESEK